MNAQRKRSPDRTLSQDEVDALFQQTGVDRTVRTVEAAALLGVHPNTLRRWALENSGPLRARKIAACNLLVWSVADIQAVLRGETPAAAEPTK